MSTSIANETKATSPTTITPTNSKDDPIKLCCTIPPDTDPGPIKP